jgi:hypothetical protein
MEESKTLWREYTPCRYLTLCRGVSDLSIIQSPFSITKCQTLYLTIRNFFIAAGGLLGLGRGRRLQQSGAWEAQTYGAVAPAPGGAGYPRSLSVSLALTLSLSLARSLSLSLALSLSLSLSSHSLSLSLTLSLSAPPLPVAPSPSFGSVFSQLPGRTHVRELTGGLTRGKALAFTQPT